jgi:hypothetical protein
MDSLFDEDIDEVGSEIEAFCPGPRCKADTHHTIVSMYEDEVRKVQCSVCSDVHPYRKPRGEAAEDTAESSSRRVTRKPTWEEAMGQVTDQELARCRPYSIRDTYKEYDVVAHPTFDVGFVTELLPDNKVEVTFKDERRVLVHNRADLAAKMPSIADLPAPRPEKKRKKRKKLKGVVEVAEQPPAPSDENALAQAKQAKREAVERAAEAKRRLTTQLAAERIKALRGSSEVADKPATRRGRASSTANAAAKDSAAPAAKASAGKRARAAKAAGGAVQKVATASKAAATAKAKITEAAKSATQAVTKTVSQKVTQKVTQKVPTKKGKTDAVLKAGAKKSVLMPAPVKLGAKKKASQGTAAPAGKKTAAKAKASKSAAAPAPTRGARAKTGPASKAKAAAPAAAKKTSRARKR